MKKKYCGSFAIAVLCIPALAAAQDGYPQASVSPAPVISTVPDPATITVPPLVFEQNAQQSQDFDKYYYFFRAETDFLTALEDIRECDGYASGLSYSNYGNSSYMNTAMNYGIGGAIGGVLGSALSDATFGAAERRRQRRINMRRCMGYKGYARYGLPKSIWEQFNFEEGLSAEESSSRERMILQQARVASSATPQYPELGL